MSDDTGGAVAAIVLVTAVAVVFGAVAYALVWPQRKAPVTTDPVLTVDTPPGEPAASVAVVPVVNGGNGDWRKTHPALWRSAMVFAVGNILLGLNFIFLSPTFRIFEQSYYLWGGIFLALGLAKIVFLNVYRNRDLVRVAMGTAFAYQVFLIVGTAEPWAHGQGSLQLPILYATLAALQLPLILEPFINPYTARSDK